jgi:hypothetical protein
MPYHLEQGASPFEQGAGVLDTRRVPSRSPSPISKSNVFLRQSGDIWGARGSHFRPMLGVPEARAGFKNTYYMLQPLGTATVVVRQLGASHHGLVRGQPGCHRPPGLLMFTQRDPEVFFKLKTHTPGFLIHEFWVGRKSSISGVWGTPGAPKPSQKYGGAKPRIFLNGL